MGERKIYRIVLLAICSVFLFLIVLGVRYVSAEDTPHKAAGQIFSTWEVFEPDKCASIWLIQRFIDKGAVIKFFPRGEMITEGIPFDVPDAKFRRYAQMSTFESIIIRLRIRNCYTSGRLFTISRSISENAK